MSDIKVHGLLVVDGDVEAGVAGSADMGKALDDFNELQEHSDEWEGLSVGAMDALGEAMDLLEIERTTSTLAVESIVHLVDELEEARDIARTLLRVAQAADVVDDEAVVYDHGDLSDASSNYCDVLDDIPDWMMRLIVRPESNPFK